MFFKKRIIIVFFMVFTINILDFIFSQYIPNSLKINIDIFVFIIELFLFTIGFIYFLTYEKISKKIKKKLDELSLDGYNFGSKCDYRLIIKLLAFIESRLASIERKNKEFKTENKQLKKKHKVYELMLNQKTSKIAKLYNNLQHQMKKSESYGRELAKRDKVKENIVAIISHELRSPLFSSINYLDVLKTTTSDDLSDMQKGFVEKVEKSLNKIEAIISEMVDVNNLTIGNYIVKLEYDEFIESFQKITSQVVEKMKSFRKLNFEIDINSNNVYFYFDKAIIRKIMDNLISNSCRFTPEGGDVKIELTKIEHNLKDFIKIAIIDNGIGIERTQLYRIFDSFYEAESLDSNILMHSSGKYDFGTRGLGIGLPIVKELVELHGGEIWSISKGKDKGSTFEFVIPIKKKLTKTIIKINREKLED